MVYQFKKGSCISADPQIAGEVCESLASTGALTGKRLLDASRSPDAPLHSAFEWDDAVAAEQYRTGQAAHIIRCLVVRPESNREEGKEPVRAFINVQSGDESRQRDYRPIGVVMQSKDLTAQMMAAALRDLEAFNNKFQRLSELAPVLAVTTAFVEEKRREAC